MSLQDDSRLSRRHQIETRILEAAERVLSETGFFAFSLRQVARETGSHPKVISHYFGDRRGLVAAVEARKGRALTDSA
jgi:AcrR family transcriptional regulator